MNQRERLLCVYLTIALVHLLVAGGLICRFFASPAEGQLSEAPEKIQGQGSRISLDPTLFSAISSPLDLGKAPPPSCPLRLAGTFFLYEGASSGVRRANAVLDIVGQGRQMIVSEGDDVAGYLVCQIARDYVVVEDDKGKRLTLFVAPLAGPDTAPPVSASSVNSSAGGKIYSSDGTLLGEQVSSNRWVLRYEALREEYERVAHSPQKMAALFLSFEDVLDVDHKTTGYELMPVIGHEFFSAIGLRTGDIIRCVNSMRMTSPRRAQYFIREFTARRLGAVVLDIERNGHTNKLIYLIR